MRQPRRTMKKTLYMLLAVLWTATVIGAIQLGNITREVVQPAIQKHSRLSHPQQAWLGALEWCESRGKPEAINPQDRDNTPSYGILQFKPSTFDSFAKAYHITGALMNPKSQEAIVTEMILRGGIDWHQQFPDCSARLGMPPLSTLKN